MMKSYHIQCPKCNNDHSFYRYGKDPDGYQKYLCRTCQHQFAPERPRAREEHRRKYPPCPVCGKASFLHHDHEHYSNYRCGDKKCNHSFSDRYSAYNIPVKSVFHGARHIRVQSFKDDVSNNLIECFNKQFKAWYKTKQGFSSFESANNLISMFVFFFNFVRPHSALNGLTPAQVAGLRLPTRKNEIFLSSLDIFLCFVPRSFIFILRCL